MAAVGRCVVVEFASPAGMGIQFELFGLRPPSESSLVRDLGDGHLLVVVKVGGNITSVGLPFS